MPVGDPAEIVRMGGVEIAGLQSDKDVVIVECTDGTLTMSYGSADLFLDSGEAVSPADVAAASKAYRDAFSRRQARTAE